MAMKYDIASITDRGNVRENNQDSILICSKEDTVLLAVADGMGGLACGQQASQLGIEALTEGWKQIYEAQTWEDASVQMENAIFEAHRRIFYLAESIGQQTGSTISALLLRGKHYMIKQVGDSRVYCLHHDSVEQLTTDQTWCNMMVQSGRLTREQAACHRLRHTLVNALGVSPELEIATEQGTIRPGETFLLCSDGFYNEMETDNLPDRLHGQNLQSVLDELLAEILQGAAKDNISAILCTARGL